MFTTFKLICSLFLGVAVMTVMPASAAADNSGTQGTELRSTQKSSDHSKAKTTSKKQAADTKAATDFSTDVDVNSLLIQEFISHYEGKNQTTAGLQVGMGLNNRPKKAWGDKADESYEFKNGNYRDQSTAEPDSSYLEGWNRYLVQHGLPVRPTPSKATEAAATQRANNGVMKSFNICKPFLGARNNFPLSNANFIDNPNGRHAIQFEKTFNDWRQTHQPNMPGMRADANDPVVSDYAKCRIAAHFWVTAAAMHLAQESIVFTSEEAAKAEIDRIFDVMDESPDLFSRIVEKTNQVWNNAICSSSLPFNDESLTFNCGIFAADATSNPPRFVVNGRETLSSNGIDGKKFKIAMSQSAGNSQSDSLDFSESDKTSKSTSAGRSATVLTK